MTTNQQDQYQSLTESLKHLFQHNFEAYVVSLLCLTTELQPWQILSCEKGCLEVSPTSPRPRIRVFKQSKHGVINNTRSTVSLPSGFNECLQNLLILRSNEVMLTPYASTIEFAVDLVRAKFPFNVFGNQDVSFVRKPNATLREACIAR